MFKREAKTSSSFSCFIREASSKEKKKVYNEALATATNIQIRTIASAAEKDKATA